jgi:hypothetical protein
LDGSKLNKSIEEEVIFREIVPYFPEDYWEIVAYFPEEGWGWRGIKHRPGVTI